LFWRKEFARYRQFPLCTGSIPYKNRGKTSVLHKMSVDDRFPLWTGFTVPANIDNLKLETVVQSLKYKKIEILVLNFLNLLIYSKFQKRAKISAVTVFPRL
jgi:hypothetical protein